MCKLQTTRLEQYAYKSLERSEVGLIRCHWLMYTYIEGKLSVCSGVDKFYWCPERVITTVAPNSNFFYHCATALSRPRPSYYRGFTITLRHTTVGRTPLEEWSACRRDLYLATHKTLKRQLSMPHARFEPTNPASERPQTQALDRAATGTGPNWH